MTGTPLPDGVAAELVRLALSDPGNPNLHLLSLVKQDLVARFPLQTAAEALARLCGKNPFHIRSLPLAGMRDYVSEAGLAYSEVISAPKTFVIREPKILGASQRGSIEALGRTIFMGAVEDAIVRPRSSLVETGGVLLLDTQDDELDAVKIVFEYDPHVLYGTDNNITLLDLSREVRASACRRPFTLVALPHLLSATGSSNTSSNFSVLYVQASFRACRF